MSDRKASIVRTTYQAEVCVAMNLDGKGPDAIQTGAPFLDRMLDLFARYSTFGLAVQCKPVKAGACDVAEEVGRCMGVALNQALGDKEGIRRLAHSFVPVDENLARAVVDVSGPSHFSCRLCAAGPAANDHDAETAEKFWKAFVSESHITLHIDLLCGGNGLPAFEALFKAAARALRDACSTEH